jgi:hypothetical protein
MILLKMKVKPLKISNEHFEMFIGLNMKKCLVIW